MSITLPPTNMEVQRPTNQEESRLSTGVFLHKPMLISWWEAMFLPFWFQKQSITTGHMIIFLGVKQTEDQTNDLPTKWNKLNLPERRGVPL